MAFAVFIAALLVSAALCALLLPLFRLMFLAIPDARSSHVKATPQGGGLVVTPVALIAAALGLAAADARPGAFLGVLAAAMLALMALGGWDDRAPLSPLIRFLVQALAAGAALAAAPLDAPALAPFLPAVLVSACALIGMLWFINLTNFMDGVDLMSVAQFVPAFTTVYLLLKEAPDLAPWVGLLCLAAAGALAGFALLNRPPARLFLGDSGSLPIGLLGGVALLFVWAARGPAAAFLPFLYYLADATLTLARRIAAGEKFWQAHRDHFYQRATKRGLSTSRVVARVAICNILLCALALLIAGRSALVQSAALALGLALVGLLMADLVRQRNDRPASSRR